MQPLATYACPTCWATIESTIDPTAGRAQRYVEDCPVCCRPNVLSITIDADENAHVEAESEAG
jgi:hypothetical protein